MTLFHIAELSLVFPLQTITPHMQPAAAKGSSSRKAYGKRYALGDNDQGNFSIDLWKKAFKDACERLCPPRAGGHECGCLPLLSRLVCYASQLAFLCEMYTIT